MKQNTFNKTLINATILICLISCTTISPALWANNNQFTTTNGSEQQTIAALQIIEPAIILNKQMVTSAKLAAFDNKHGRIELTLTTKASKLLDAMGKLKKNQKLIFTINDQISDGLLIQKEINKNYFVLSISTSRKNADLIMKFFS